MRSTPASLLLLLVSLGALASAPGAARANDSAMGGDAADLSPERRTEVRMASEDIVLENRGDAEWRVEAHYVFENATDRAVDLQMGFPEHRCDPEGESDCAGTGAFREMRTTVRGVAVPQRVGVVSPRSPWHTRLGDVYLYDVRFAPRERVEVHHSYVVDGDVSVMGRGITYLTLTGHNWNGPIGRARFTVRLHETPWAHDATRELPRVAARRVPLGAGTGYELVFERARWTPRGNFRFDVFDRHGLLEMIGCAADDSSRLASLDDATLRTCRNLPYARHGRPLADRGLRRLFYARGLPAWEGKRLLPYVEQPDFDERWLTRDDHRLVAAIQAEQRRRATGVAAGAR